MAILLANSGDPDQTPRSAASDLGLHCLPITFLVVSRLQWVKINQNPSLMQSLQNHMYKMRLNRIFGLGEALLMNIHNVCLNGEIKRFYPRIFTKYSLTSPLIYLQAHSSMLTAPSLGVVMFSGHGLHSKFRPGTSLYVPLSHFSQIGLVPLTSISFCPTLQ